jgi:hypothetical protein
MAGTIRVLNEIAKAVVKRPSRTGRSRVEQPSYIVRGANLEGIRNRNEARVAALLPGVLDSIKDYAPGPLEIQDIFALTLNLLPSRYAQRFSFVLREPLTDQDIVEQIREAVERIRSHPKSDGY